MFSTGNWEVEGGGGAAETKKKNTNLKSAKVFEIRTKQGTDERCP